jgi:hypothetical protein
MLRHNNQIKFQDERTGKIIIQDHKSVRDMTESGFFTDVMKSEMESSVDSNIGSHMDFSA